MVTRLLLVRLYNILVVAKPLLGGFYDVLVGLTDFLPSSLPHENPVHLTSTHPAIICGIFSYL